MLVNSTALKCHDNKLFSRNFHISISKCSCGISRMMGNPIPDPIGPIGHGFEEGHPWYLQNEHMVDKKADESTLMPKHHGFFK